MQAAQVAASRPSRWRTLTVALETAALAIIVAAASWLRFLGLGARSLWVDEGSSYAIARMDWWNFLRLLWRREANMSFYYLLLRGWLAFTRLMAPSEAYLRALSAICGVAAVIAIYLAGRKLWGATSGVLAAFLLALHAYHIRYSQEARGYSLAVLLVILSVLFLLRLREKATNGNLWLYSLISALAVYAHFYSFLVLLAEWMALCLAQNMRDTARPAIRRTLLLLVPAALFIAFTGTGPLAWTHRPSAHELHVFAICMTGGGTDALIWAYSFFAAAGFFIAWRSDRSTSRIFKPLLVLLWCVLPIVLVLAVSLLKPVFANRFFVICVPALCLLASAIASSSAGKLRWLALPAAAVLGFLSFVAVQRFQIHGLDAPAEDWRSATRAVLAQSNSSDGIIFYSSQGKMPFGYYEQRALQAADSTGASIPDIIFPAHQAGKTSFQDFMGKPDAQQLSSASPLFKRVWLVMCHDMIRGSYDAETLAIRSELSTQYRQRSDTSLPGIHIELYSSPKK